MHQGLNWANKEYNKGDEYNFSTSRTKLNKYGREQKRWKENLTCVYK